MQRSSKFSFEIGPSLATPQRRDEKSGSQKEAAAFYAFIVPLVRGHDDAVIRESTGSCGCALILGGKCIHSIVDCDEICGTHLCVVASIVCHIHQ